MDFTSNRGVQTSMARTPSGNGRSTSDNNNDKKDRKMRGTPRWLKVTSVLLLFAGTAIVVGIIALLLVNPGNESRLVEKDKYQAVFLDNGQVYFGKINSMNSSYIDLLSIYYLNVDQSVQPQEESDNQNVTLQKLGCELHGPTDRMVINREHVVFWENLRVEGKVTKAIQDWISNNPDGLICNGNDSTQTESTDTGSDTTTDDTTNNGNSDQSTTNQ